MKTRNRIVALVISLLILASIACNDCNDIIALGSDAYCNSGTSQ